MIGSTATATRGRQQWTSMNRMSNGNMAIKRHTRGFRDMGVPPSPHRVNEWQSRAYGLLSTLQKLGGTSFRFLFKAEWPSMSIPIISRWREIQACNDNGPLAQIVDLLARLYPFLRREKFLCRNVLIIKKIEFLNVAFCPRRSKNFRCQSQPKSVVDDARYPNG
jgi:hypothetical protein